MLCRRPFSSAEAVKVPRGRTMVKQRGGNDESEDRFEDIEPEPSPARCVKQCGEIRPWRRQINLHHAGLLCQCLRPITSSLAKHVKQACQVECMSLGLAVSCLRYSETPTVEMRRAWHREPQWLGTHHILVTSLWFFSGQFGARTCRTAESILLTL